MANDEVFYARNVSLPLRFDASADLALDTDEELIDQAIQLVVFTLTGSFPLFTDFGSTTIANVFDPLDNATQLQFDNSIRNGLTNHEPRVFLDKEFIFDERRDQNELIVIVPFKIKVTGRLAASRVIIPRPPVD